MLKTVAMRDLNLDGAPLKYRKYRNGLGTEE